ncbi:MAG: hydrogenase iron-sulfur subunit [candidate division WOR-3 bacterium]|nr:MAG: hydrogenase iron-sulfur subunit [candidate division WOR-3 bacterium]
MNNKIRVLICNCHGSVKLPKLEFGPDTIVEQHDNLCNVKPKISAEDKVVIAGCSPNLLEGIYPEINAEFVNIFEHIALIGHPAEKANALIAAAIEKAKHTEPIKKKTFEIKHKKALVVGGGIAGIEVAFQLSKNGVDVTLIEKKPFLGGTVAKLDRLYPEGTPYSHTLMPLISNLGSCKKLERLVNTTLTEVSGRPGDYRVALKTVPRGVVECINCGKCIDVCPVEVDDDGKKRKAIYYLPTYPDSYAIDFDTCTKCGECVKICPGKIDLNEKINETEINVGAIVVATGLNWYDVKKVEEYGYGRLEGVMKTLEFERAVASGTLHPKKVAVIYCAGSRDTNHLPYCSKICCLLGLKEAKLVKDRFPEAEVYVIAMDMRSYGTFEYLYNKLRDRGVSFVKGKPSEILKRNGSLVVRTEDLYTNELLEIDVDSVVLSSGFIADTETFSKLNIKLDGDFPVLFENAGLGSHELPRGIFTAGAATFPSGVAETLIDARKASSSALNLLREDRIETRLPQAKVDEEQCSLCRMCIGTCPYKAISIVDDKIKINEELCMGCGICSVTCPSYASQLEGWNHRGLYEQIRALVDKGDLLAIMCRWSAYNATERAAQDRLSYGENVKIMRVPCTGAVDPSHVMLALNKGARGVLIGGCYPDACHYARGNFRAKARESILRMNLELMGMDKNRVRLEWIGKDEAQKFIKIVEEMNK